MLPFEHRIAHFGFLLARATKAKKSKWKRGLVERYGCATGTFKPLLFGDQNFGPNLSRQMGKIFENIYPKTSENKFVAVYLCIIEKILKKTVLIIEKESYDLTEVWKFCIRCGVLFSGISSRVSNESKTILASSLTTNVLSSMKRKFTFCPLFKSSNFEQPFLPCRSVHFIVEIF